MKNQIILFVTLLTIISCTSSQNNSQKLTITKMEIHLSAFGVESDDFPSIEGFVDFANDTNSCMKSYYNPAYKSSTYKLSHIEINKVLELLQKVDLDKMKKEYS